MAYSFRWGLKLLTVRVPIIEYHFETLSKLGRKFELIFKVVFLAQCMSFLGHFLHHVHHRGDLSTEIFVINMIDIVLNKVLTLSSALLMLSSCLICCCWSLVDEFLRLEGF